MTTTPQRISGMRTIWPPRAADEAIQETRRDEELIKLRDHQFPLRTDELLRAPLRPGDYRCNKTIALDPSFYVARRYLGLAYAQKECAKRPWQSLKKRLPDRAAHP
jgi:hypothetical protein